MSAQEIYYGALALAALGGMLFGAYKLRPESSRIFVESAEVTVRMANEARDEIAEDLVALKAELAERKREEAVYRSDVEARLAELSAQLRAEKAEKEHVKAENDRLRKRVDELETEVARLKASNGFDDH